MLSFLRLNTRCQHTLTKISSLIKKKPGEAVKIQGWVQNVRKMKKNIFADINDGSSCLNIQVVLSKNTPANMGAGDSVEVKGLIGLTPKNQLEIQAQELKIIGECKIDEGYPFTPKQIHEAEYVREHLHLRSKVKYMQSLFRIRHRATKLIHDFMDESGLVNIHTPILTTNDCEGAGEIFTVKPESTKLLQRMFKANVNIENAFFDRKVFLSVSGQLCLEAISHGLGNVYTFGPAFRAENSKSSLHLSEFYMLEAELTFVSELEAITSFIERTIKTVSEKLLSCCEKDIENCLSEGSSQNFRSFDWLRKEWAILTFEDAFNILDKNREKLTTTVKQTEGFSKEQELLLVKHVGSPIFVVNWPQSIKPFYMKVMPSDPTKVLAVDLLMPEIGELVGGSIRENDFKQLKSVIPEGLEWYLDLRKFGGVPTGGFGLGFERYIKLITGMRNIRDVIPFPRYPHSCVM